MTTRDTNKRVMRATFIFTLGIPERKAGIYAGMLDQQRANRLYKSNR